MNNAIRVAARHKDLGQIKTRVNWISNIYMPDKFNRRYMPVIGVHYSLTIARRSRIIR